MLQGRKLVEIGVIRIKQRYWFDGLIVCASGFGCLGFLAGLGDCYDLAWGNKSVWSGMGVGEDVVFARGVSRSGIVFKLLTICIEESILVD